MVVHKKKKHQLLHMHTAMLVRIFFRNVNNLLDMDVRTMPESHVQKLQNRIWQTIEKGNLVHMHIARFAGLLFRNLH